MFTIALNLAFVASGALALPDGGTAQQTGIPPIGPCSKQWSSILIDAKGVSDPQGHPGTDVLGDTPGTFVSLAPGGCIEVSFTGPFGHDGTGFSDIGIDILDPSDCYEIALRPLNMATTTAITNLGWVHVGNLYYKPVGLIECGDQNWDIDFYAPGLPTDTLQFTSIRICNPASAQDDLQVNRVWGNIVCPCVGPPAAVVSHPCGYSQLDPVLTADPMVVLTAPNLYLDSQFPFVPGWYYLSAPSQQALNVNGCDFWLTLPTLYIFATFVTDANGDHVQPLPVLWPGLVGIRLAIQGRVCAPNLQTPGPFFPAPDFFSNTLIVTFGCPPTNPTGGI